MNTENPTDSPSPRTDQTADRVGASDRDWKLRPGFAGSFSGIISMMLAERISTGKLIRLALQLLIIPAMLLMILNSPITLQDNRRSARFDRQFEEPEQEQLTFESFMGNADAALENQEIINQKKRDAEKAFAGIESQYEKNKARIFFLIVYDFYLMVGVPLICVILSGGVSRDEIRNDTLPYFLCRPLTRMAYISFRLIAQVLWLEIILGLHLVLILAVGLMTGTVWIGESVPYVLLSQLLSIPVWCALGIFMGLVNKNYLIFSILYGLIVEIGIASLPSNIKFLSMLAHVKAILGQAQLSLTLRPNWDIPLHFQVSIIPLIVGFVFFLILTAILFHFKELLPSKEAEK